MNLRQLAEMLLTVRAASKRIVACFEVYDDRMKLLGVDPSDLPRVLAVIQNIEHYTESQLATLEQKPAT